MLMLTKPNKIGADHIYLYLESLNSESLPIYNVLYTHEGWHHFQLKYLYWQCFSIPVLLKIKNAALIWSFNGSKNIKNGLYWQIQGVSVKV